ncbi:MAG: CoA transferase, partial [Candidatus Omnitrophica bacterium]|nr:CoA transferase [Candidatus Omnitrophota bacterium]
ICQALYYREKTGKGQFIDLSMLDLMYALNLRTQIREYMPQAKRQRKTEQILPTYNQFPTKDGLKVGIVTITEKQFAKLCGIIGRLDLLKDKRFKNSVREVATNIECGIGVAGFNDFQQGDIIQIYQKVVEGMT